MRTVVERFGAHEFEVDRGPDPESVLFPGRLVTHRTTTYRCPTCEDIFPLEHGALHQCSCGHKFVRSGNQLTVTSRVKE